MDAIVNSVCVCVCVKPLNHTEHENGLAYQGKQECLHEDILYFPFDISHFEF